MDVDVDAGELCERRVECVGHCRHCTVPTLTSPGTCLGGEGGRCDWCTHPLEAMPEPLQSKKGPPAGRRRTVMHSARSHSYGTKAGGPRAPECQTEDLQRDHQANGRPSRGGAHRQETQQGFSRASTRALAGPSGANWHRRVPGRRGARPSLGVCPASAAPSPALRELAQRPAWVWKLIRGRSHP